MSEYVQFAGAMISFVGILVESYFFLLTRWAHATMSAVRVRATENVV